MNVAAKIEPWEVPYDSAEHAFFCMADRQRARADGARFSPTGFERPGTGLDVQKTIERLYREGQLSVEHIKVLRHFGKLGMRPCKDVANEKRAADLWDEAMKTIETQLKKKGIVQ